VQFLCNLFSQSQCILLNTNKRAPLDQSSDKNIMFQVRDGDIDQLQHLFHRHHARLYNFFVGMTNNRVASQDLTQEVFLRILRFRHTFKGNGSFASWMFRIARNVGMDYFRKSKQADPLYDVENELVSDDLDPLEESTKSQEMKILRAALQRISVHHREVLIMNRFEHLKVREIAKILNCPVNTIKVRIHRAIKELGAVYQEISGVL